MHNNKSFLAIIPARGGSKGIPGKNTYIINNKPIIQYTIEAAKQSKYIDKIVVSTEDEAIAQTSIECGAEVPFLRPSKFASDSSNTIDAIIYTLKKLEENNEFYDYIILLQPTQPLRQAFHIDQSIELLINQKSESLVSVTKVKEHPILVRSISKKGKLESLLNINSTVRRQEFPDFYKVNGAIYINKINENLTLNTSLNDNEIPYFMDPKYDLDIDEPFDLEIFKLKLKMLGSCD